MNPKTKAIIIVVGALILFGILVATIFDLFPSRESEPDAQEQEVVLPDRDEGLPEGAVFDASNAGEFNDLNPAVFSDDDASVLEDEAKDLAEFFIERFGTYSSDADFANINDLLGFMSASMQSEMTDYKRQTSQQGGYYSVASEIAGIETKTFSLAQRQAQFDIVLGRTEESSGTMQTYNQEVSVYLVQDSTGHWKVNKVVWGQKI